MLFTPSLDPLSITLLVLPEASLMTLAATVDPLRAANRVAAREIYRWEIVSLDGSQPVTSGGMPIPVHGAFDPARRRDALVVLAAFNVLHHATRPVLRAFRTGARHATMVGGFEGGAWVLGLAGLLDGRAATTHWEDLEEFAARFPLADVRPDRWVIDGPVFTAGGAMPALDLMLALVRARQGLSTALDVASLYVYDETRASSEAQPLVSLGRLRESEPRVAAAIRVMEAHLDQPLPVSAIARRSGVSTRRLETLFREAVSASPGAYYLALRLKAARRLVLDTRLPMVDVAERTGFSSISALSRAFRREYGLPPSAARKAAQRPSP
ncbi:transcriptional regulator GlxA family with amidase domain [Amaricoccus macauensis]|uniref:Transcriptional regulator GlxA family with amidase domain n=1 Tax=Amaricoccus macauensis TaxID=57001 RepID=A0A840SN51_9RHOB|nr:GlxA family transcriptional regulator [Amaricoccus macauensis]MBB5222180.1 transcriptional regulator GlxA family with amidase domain [Amaricoccus macauensis]